MLSPSSIAWYAPCPKIASASIRPPIIPRMMLKIRKGRFIQTFVFLIFSRKNYCPVSRE
uniref:Uncharacterized protein n=1 Tax=Anguilla anguilla TaxID=7936 RepID=A0A0E9XDH5_ANGAN